MSPAERMKEAISVQALLEREGLRPDRSGFLRCPFHDGDHTASLKIYPDGKGWYCFGCHKGGDVINLARELYGLDFKGAVKRLDRDFGLHLDRSEPLSRKEELAQWKRRQEAEDRALEHQLDLEEWADCNHFIQTWPHWLNPWPWCWAQERLAVLTYKLERYEQKGGG